MPTLTLDVSEQTAHIFGKQTHISEQDFLKKKFGIETDNGEVSFPVDMQGEEFLKTMQTHILDT